MEGKRRRKERARDLSSSRIEQGDLISFAALFFFFFNQEEKI